MTDLPFLGSDFEQNRALWLQMARGEWRRVGTAGVKFGAKFADFSGAYQCWWRKDAMGMMHFQGLFKATATTVVTDPIISLDPGLRPSADPGFSFERTFAVACNASTFAQKATMVSLVAGGASVGQVFCGEAITIGGWISLDTMSYLVEA